MLKSMESFLDEKPFSPENYTEMLLAIKIMPKNANASLMTDELGKKSTFYQLLAVFDQSYGTIDENGVILDDDNATSNTVKVKFNSDNIGHVTIQQFKDFFEKHYLNKKQIVLPLSSFKPSESSKKIGDKTVRTPLKGVYDAVVSKDFRLIDLINSVENPVKKS